MKRLINKIFFLVTCNLLLVSCLLSAAETETSADILNTFINSLNTYQADFTQSIFGQSGQQIDQASGSVNLQKPGKFNWTYHSPYSQKLISDGETLWIYDVDLEQVTINDIDLSRNNSPAAILSGNVDINSHYTVNELGEFDGYRWVELIPIDPEQEFSAVRLGISEGQLSGMVLFDNLGQTTVIQFENILTNLAINTDVYNFELPDGVDVIDSRQIQDFE